MPRIHTKRSCVGLALGVVLIGGLTPSAHALPVSDSVIAFANNGQIWSIGSDGRGARLLVRRPRLPHTRQACWPQIADTAPAWSPNGKMLAFQRYGCALRKRRQGIYVSRADGSHQRWLTAGGDPDWSPDGKEIVFVRPSQRPSPDGSGCCTASTAVWVIDVDGTGIHEIANDAAQPTWSPDGSTIAISTANYAPFGSIELMNPDGSDRHLLGSPGLTLAASPAWSPDGRRLAFVDGKTGTIATIDADGTDEVDLPPPPVPGYLNNPAWSPDGKRIAFSGGSYDLWVMNATGGQMHDLTPWLHKQWRPDWQPVRGKR